MADSSRPTAAMNFSFSSRINICSRPDLAYTCTDYFCTAEAYFLSDNLAVIRAWLTPLVFRLVWMGLQPCKASIVTVAQQTCSNQSRCGDIPIPIRCGL